MDTAQPTPGPRGRFRIAMVGAGAAAVLTVGASAVLAARRSHRIWLHLASRSRSLQRPDAPRGRIGVDFQVSNARIRLEDNSYLRIDLANGAALTFDDFWTKGRLVFLQVSNAQFHLSAALRNGDLDIAIRLIDEGEEGVSVSEELRNLNPGSTSPATIEFLINAGADPDLRNSSGFTFREIVRWTYEYEHDFVDPVDRRIPEMIFALVR